MVVLIPLKGKLHSIPYLKALNADCKYHLWEKSAAALWYFLKTIYCTSYSGKLVVYCEHSSIKKLYSPQKSKLDHLAEKNINHNYWKIWLETAWLKKFALTNMRKWYLGNSYRQGSGFGKDQWPLTPQKNQIMDGARQDIWYICKGCSTLIFYQ